MWNRFLKINITYFISREYLKLMRGGQGWCGKNMPKCIYLVCFQWQILVGQTPFWNSNFSEIFIVNQIPSIGILFLWRSWYCFFLYISDLFSFLLHFLLSFPRVLFFISSYAIYSKLPHPSIFPISTFRRKIIFHLKPNKYKLSPFLIYFLLPPISSFDFDPNLKVPLSYKPVSWMTKEKRLI